MIFFFMGKWEKKEELQIRFLQKHSNDFLQLDFKLTVKQGICGYWTFGLFSPAIC